MEGTIPVRCDKSAGELLHKVRKSEKSVESLESSSKQGGKLMAYVTPQEEKWPFKKTEWLRDGKKEGFHIRMYIFV